MNNSFDSFPRKLERLEDLKSLQRYWTSTRYTETSPSIFRLLSTSEVPIRIGAALITNTQ